MGIIGDIISGVVSGGTSMIGSIGGLIQNQNNIHAQEQANRQNIALQQQTNYLNSITNKVNELKANGLNKQLATGMSPNYSLSAHINPAKGDSNAYTNLMNAPGRVLDVMSSLADLKYKNAMTDNAKIEGAIKGQALTSARMDNVFKAYANELMMKRGIIPGDTTRIKELQFIIDNLKSIIPQASDTFDSLINHNNFLKENLVDKPDRKKSISNIEKGFDNIPSTYYNFDDSGRQSYFQRKEYLYR